MTIKEIYESATIVVNKEEISIILTALRAGERRHNSFMLPTSPKDENPFYKFRMEFQKQLTQKFGWPFSD